MISPISIDIPCSMQFFVIFLALDNTIAPGQQPNMEGRNSTDGLALALSTCTPSVCIARLRPWILG